jgi:hypothetical protein
VLVHSDVILADAFFPEKLDAATQWFDVIGLVGSAHFDEAAIADHCRWSLWPRESLSGAVEHLYDSLACWSSFGPTPRRCLILDGLLLAVDMLTLGSLRFDPRFAFHLYDLDFCLAAHRAGLACGTTNIYAQHLSHGNYQSDAYRAALAAFRKKWKGARERC